MTRDEWFQQIDAHLEKIVIWSELQGRHRERGEEEDARRHKTLVAQACGELMFFLTRVPLPPPERG